MARKRTQVQGGVVPQEYALVPVAALQPHPRNVNEGDVGAIITSIRANQFFGAVVAQKSTGRILAGKHRWIAAQEEGLEAIPTIWADVDDNTALRIMLADNRTARIGHDDPEQLAGLLQEMIASAGTLDGTGFTGDDLDELLADLSGGPVVDASPGSDESGQLKERFQVLVTCHTEQQQGEVLEQLHRKGLECRALIS